MSDKAVEPTRSVLYLDNVPRSDQEEQKNTECEKESKKSTCKKSKSCKKAKKTPEPETSTCLQVTETDAHLVGILLKVQEMKGKEDIASYFRIDCKEHLDETIKYAESVLTQLPEDNAYNLIRAARMFFKIYLFDLYKSIRTGLDAYAYNILELIRERTSPWQELETYFESYLDVHKKYEEDFHKEGI